MESITISELSVFIMMGINLVGMFLIHRSVPVKIVDELIEKGANLAERTTITDLDDKLVEIAKMLRNQWMPTTVTSTDLDTGVTTTHDVMLSVEGIASEVDNSLGTNMTADWLDAIEAEKKRSEL